MTGACCKLAGKSTCRLLVWFFVVFGFLVAWLGFQWWVFLVGLGF